MDRQLEYRMRALRAHLAMAERVAVGFSGGVDSTFLLAVAHDVLGANAVAVTGASPSYPARERDEAAAFCQQRGIRQIEFETLEFDDPAYLENPPNRCYLCKRTLFSQVTALAEEQGLGRVCDGSNADDLLDYRPGRQALAELGVDSPLASCGFTKDDIRQASREMGLPTADKPSFACLASRVPYGQGLSRELLAKVDAAERALIGLGFPQVRVRVNGVEARIEVPPADLPRAFDQRAAIVPAVRDAGFTYVTLDLQGYRTGAMNEALPKRPQASPRQHGA